MNLTPILTHIPEAGRAIIALNTNQQHMKPLLQQLDENGVKLHIDQGQLMWMLPAGLADDAARKWFLVHEQQIINGLQARDAAGVTNP